MTQLEEMQNQISEFRNARNWAQFHKPKDLALSLVLEASEVLEHFQWKNEQEVDEYIRSHQNEIGEELVDTLYWVLLMANDLKIDLSKAFQSKMEKNNEKYPVSKSKDNHKKYTEIK